MGESEGLKSFLGNKLNKSQANIKKLERNRKIYKILYVTTTVSSIFISIVLASITALPIPPWVFTILAIASGFLTGISVKFNFQDKTIEINRKIDRLDKIQSKLDYVISCNGDLTSEKIKKIMSKFNL
jgi:hypothetical protein